MRTQMDNVSVNNRTQESILKSFVVRVPVCQIDGSIMKKRFIY